MGIVGTVDSDYKPAGSAADEAWRSIRGSI